MERRFFDHRDVGHGGAARERTFEQVVAQHLVVGQALREHGVHRAHVEQALAAERAFAEHVLVDLGGSGAVGVDATLAGKQPVVQREVLRCRQRRDDARLQDAVAARDAARAGIELRFVVRVRSHADELAQPPRWQLGVAVERDDVAGVRLDTREFAQIDERAAAIGRGLGQQRDQLLELAAFALPADPALLGLVIQAPAVQHDEPRRAARCAVVAQVECCDRVDGRGEEFGVVRPGLGVGVGPVGEQRELCVRFRVGEVVQLDPVRQFFGGAKAGQHARDHDHHAVLGRNALRQREPRQPVRARRFADQPVDHRDHGLGRGEQHQRGPEQGRPHARGGRPAMAQQHPGDQHQRAAGQCREVGRERGAAPQSTPQDGAELVQAEAPDQRRPARATQPMARGGAGARHVVTVHQLQQRGGDVGFAAAAAPREHFDRVQRVVAGVVAFRLEGRRGEQQLHRCAGAADDVGPVSVADQPQRADRVAHAQVVGGLVGRLLCLRRRHVGQPGQQPGPCAVVCGRVVVSQALSHLDQKGPCHTAWLEQREHGIELPVGGHVEAVADEVGEFARGLVAGQPLGQAAQVLDQHHPQRRRQRPQLGQRQLAPALVGGEKVREQLFVEGAVGVCDEGPGHAVDARQTRQGLLDQYRQVAEVAPRQAFVNLLELAFDQVEVVEQPLGRRADLVAGLCLLADVTVRGTQRADVVLEPREERGRAAPPRFGAVGLRQAQAVLRKTFGAEDFRADRWLDHALRGGQNVTQLPRCLGYQAGQAGWGHASCFTTQAR